MAIYRGSTLVSGAGIGAGDDTTFTGSITFDKGSSKNTVKMTDGLDVSNGATSAMEINIGDSLSTDNTVIGRINFKGDDDASTPTQHDFARIEGILVDNANAAGEDGKLDLEVLVGGTLHTGFSVDGGSSKISYGHNATWEHDFNGDIVSDLSLLGVDAGATGPKIEFYHDSASPFDDDELGKIEFHGETTDGTKAQFASITAYAEDVSAQEGLLELRVENGATDERTFTIDGGNSNHFRIENSEGYPHLVLVNGSSISSDERVGRIEFSSGTKGATNYAAIEANAVSNLGAGYLTIVARSSSADVDVATFYHDHIVANQPIRIGGTGTANELDDYEEGTFEPTAPSANNITYSSSSDAKYVKVGRLVHVQIELVVPTNTNSSDEVAVSNLPFAISAYDAAQTLGTASIDGYDNTTLHRVARVGDNNTCVVTGLYYDDASADGVVLELNYFTDE